MSDDIEDKEITEKQNKYQWTKDRIISAVIFTIIMLISLALLIIVIFDRYFFFYIIIFFVEPLEQMKTIYQILIFLGLMILQSLFAPIPSELLLLTSGILWGIYLGSFIGLLGSLLSAIPTYYLARRGGRSMVDASGERISLIRRTTYLLDEWVKTWGIWAILVGRAVPAIAFDPISYAAGLANIKQKPYFFITFLGSIPRAIFYAVVGNILLGTIPTNQQEIDTVSSMFNIAFYIVFGILGFIFILSNIIYYRRKKKKELQKDETSQQEPDLVDDSNIDEQKKIKTTNLSLDHQSQIILDE